ncbi:MAG: glycerophosphodiester phosphodiesterase family protein [Roseateles asaccharophilus]|uniref:glycerophosphodiester phosphodiesterase n=1 Tax=Roseateles asaccharophilus TaxID=582607 RepID=A0A4R6NCZ1_9BURK|nr:glycerophosphodiester phosphodiesterase family protein [Roseateles asaccharophilus]MDN3542881.1 glycerophosphodiester phosphodiesterase family protein [Roseateles asaccharophilus]TDP13420.1 glycerophosphoryl diester phosphodiesterase [Roseateles asaccharophilus]
MPIKTPAVRSWAAALLLTLSGGWALAQPLLIAHRGASGHRPEHTLAAYELAIEQGADYIEPDLVMSKDGVLLARHEPLLARVELEADGRTIKRGADGKPVLHRTDTSSNVWQLDKYADRLTVKLVDGRPMAGWFAEDFTAAEIRADIRAQERLRDLRLANKAFDDRLPIPTLDEVIALAQARGVGIYPETKHPSYFKAFTDAAGLPRMEDTLLKALHAAWGNRAEAPVFIQSFEVANLQYLRGKTKLRLVQLLSANGKPYDFNVAGDARGYAELAQPAGLDFIKRYADGVGPHLNLMIPPSGAATPLIAEAHKRGLKVHGWTFRAENSFLPAEFRREGQALGDMAGQLKRFLDLGMDGFFTDQPDVAAEALKKR